MNENGKSVAKAVNQFSVVADDVFLVHDDLELPLGKCVIKMGGSAKGHNGVRSTMAHLQSDVSLVLINEKWVQSLNFIYKLALQSLTCLYMNMANDL
jgi:peptidyl-tRNA hydrolase